MDHTDEFDDNDNNALDLDDILPQVGEFGRYQKLMLWLVCLPACFPCGFCAFNQLFMADVPPHVCYVEELQTLPKELRLNISIPRNKDGTFETCRMYAMNWTAILEDNVDDLEAIVPNVSWPTQECGERFEFDTSEVLSSIVIDFGLVCKKDIYPTLALVLLNFGGPIGVYSFGLLNDYIGRKKSFFLCLTTLLLGNFLTASAQNFWWWASSRFIVGLTVPAVYQIPFIISLELVGPNYRSFVTVLTCIFYTFGLIMLSAIAYLVRDWVHLTLATSVPFLLYYIYWFFLPESPRWLLARGRFEEASKILEVLARTNNRQLPVSFRQQLKQRAMRQVSASEEGKTSKKASGLSALCGSSNMRLKTLLITFNWFANEMVYVGLSYYGPSLGSNEYLSFFLSSAVELPSYIACCLIMDRWGRRWPLCICMIISGVSCIGTVMVPEDSTATLVLFLISKCTISASFLIIYPFAGELYPTQLRGVGIGTSAYIAGLGLVIIPFITYLGSEMLTLPLVIMGGVSIIGGISGLRLPETLHYRLPQTLEEGEEFGKDFTWQDCFRCIPLRPDGSKESTFCEAEAEMELGSVLQEKEAEETTALTGVRHLSIKKLARQASVMDTQKNSDGSMVMTYWF